MRSCSLGASSGVVTETSSTLVNWVLANHATRIAPRRARLGPERRRAGSNAQRQFFLVEDRLADKIGQWHFRRRDKPERPFGKLMIPIFEIEFGVEIIARVPHRGDFCAVALVEPAALGTTDEIFDELFATHFRLGLDRVSLFAAAALVFQHSVEPCNRLKECRELIVAKLR